MISSDKKLVKSLKNCIFLCQFAQIKGSLWTTPKIKSNFFFLTDITKADDQLSETYYFIKLSYVLTELWIFFLSWVKFFFKRVAFPAKTAAVLLYPLLHCFAQSTLPYLAQLYYTFLVVTTHLIHKLMKYTIEMWKFS